MKKKILVGAIAAFLLILLICGIALFAPSKKFTVAFYKISDKQRQGITEVLGTIAEEKGITMVFQQYNADKTLESQLLFSKKPNIIITRSGFAVDAAVEKATSKATVPLTFSDGMTSSMRSAIKKNNERIAALPILSSHLEVDIDTTEFRSSNTKQINTWSDVEKFMREQKRRKDSPMVLAGGNSDFFLDFVGAFAESIDGVSSYREAAAIVKTEKNPAKAAVLLCDEPNSPLATTVRQLTSWYRQGLLHQGTFSLQMNDVEAFASSRLISVFSMSLEDHRAVSQNTISRYSSIYFPSEHNANARIFTGTTVYAVPMTKSKNNEIVMGALINTQNQEILSRKTGIAPVLAQCRTPDKQADDARYWIAATAAPFAGLSNEVYLTKEQKNGLAAEIAARIRR